MKIVRPKVEEWIPKDNISHVARCARVCYAINNNSLYKRKYKIKIISYGCK